MKRIWRNLALAGLLGVGGGLSATAAQGQTVVTYGTPVVVAPTAGYVVQQPARRDLRRANRYNTLRPVYGKRQAVTFAPYSDRYFPTANAPAPTTYYVPVQPTYTVVAPR